MTNKLSFSKIRLYQECPRKYKYHYIDRLRSTEYKGFFLFGSAIDAGLNHLLLTKNLQESIEKFDESFTNNYINKVKTYMPEATNVVWAEADFDAELLKPEDIQQINKALDKTNIFTNDDVKEIFNQILEIKEKKGFQNLHENYKKTYCLLNWLSIRRKGHIMIESYAKQILPRIKKVHKIQGTTSLKNSEGDSVDGFLDLIFEWEDGKNYLGDNKTSARKYKENSTEKSPQLIGYYHSVKKEYNLQGVAFFVMMKSILKNRTKICSVCGNNGTGERHKTCAKMIIPNKTLLTDPPQTPKAIRCNGEWIETITPECNIDVIMSEVPETAENLVLDAFDCANEGIKKESFGPNLNACGDADSDYRCQYFNLCWKNNKDGLIEVEDKK